MDLVLLGLVIGMANAVLAVGLVLVHMSTRVINFAHGELGAFGVSMMLYLSRVLHLDYAVAFAGSLAATALLAAVVERTVIARLATAPRLVVLLATIGVSQVITVVRLILPKPAVNGHLQVVGVAGFPVALHHPVLDVGRVVLQAQDLVVLVVSPLAVLGVAAFLRRSIYGVSIRASAENASRARLLGIPVARVSTLAWVVAAVLAATASILIAPVIGFSSGEAIGLPLLLRGLAAATCARFESVGKAFGYGLLFGVVDQLVTFYTGRAGLTDAIVLGFVLVVLMLQRVQARRTTAAEESSFVVAEAFRALPARVRAHPSWRRLQLVVGLPLLALGLLAPFVLTPAVAFLVATIWAVSIVTMALTVLSGWAGQLSIGHWALAGVGAILAARVLGSGVPFVLALAVAAAAGGAVALLLGLPALRLPGTLLAVVTLGFAVVSETWLFSQPWFKGHGTGVVSVPGWLTDRVYYYLAAGLALAVYAGLRVLQASRFGRNVAAVRDNPRQAAAMGVPVVRTQLTAFVVSGAIAGFGGFLYSAGTGVAATSAFPAERSLTLLTAAVVGGLGSLGGAVLGTAYLQGSAYFGGETFSLLATGFGVLFLVLVLPGGLARVVFFVRDRVAAVVTRVPAPGPPPLPLPLAEAGARR